MQSVNDSKRNISLCAVNSDDSNELGNVVCDFDLSVLIILLTDVYYNCYCKRTNS